MTRERWGWILVALAAVLLGAVTHVRAVSAQAHHPPAAGTPSP